MQVQAAALSLLLLFVVDARLLRLILNSGTLFSAAATDVFGSSHFAGMRADALTTPPAFLFGLVFLLAT